MDADALIVERAKRDAVDGAQKALELVREGHNRLVAATLGSIVSAAMATMRVTHIEDEARLILATAHRHAAGEDPRALAEEAFPKLLHLKRTDLLVRADDPAYPPLREMFVASYARRLPDLARMATVKDPASYDDVVRKAFPTRAEVDRIVDEQREFALGAVAHVEANPRVLRVPGGMVPRLAKSAREMIEWQHARVKVGVGELYG